MLGGMRRFVERHFGYPLVINPSPSNAPVTETPRCACGGTGVVLVEGPCDTAPLEAPCPCLEGRPYELAGAGSPDR